MSVQIQIRFVDFNVRIGSRVNTYGIPWLILIHIQKNHFRTRTGDGTFVNAEANTLE
jgi:hypothetical protein